MDNAVETPSYLLEDVNGELINLDGSPPTLEQWRAKAKTIPTVAEGAYRRGVHQTLVMIGYFLEDNDVGRGDIREAVSQWEERARKIRFDKKAHPALLHEIMDMIKVER